MSDPLPTITFLHAQEVLRLVTLMEALLSPAVQRHLRSALRTSQGDGEFLIRALIPALNACLPEPLTLTRSEEATP